MPCGWGWFEMVVNALLFFGLHFKCPAMKSSQIED